MSHSDVQSLRSPSAAEHCLIFLCRGTSRLCKSYVTFKGYCAVSVTGMSVLLDGKKWNTEKAQRFQFSTTVTFVNLCKPPGEHVTLL